MQERERVPGLDSLDDDLGGGMVSTAGRADATSALGPRVIRSAAQMAAGWASFGPSRFSAFATSLRDLLSCRLSSRPAPAAARVQAGKSYFFSLAAASPLPRLHRFAFFNTRALCSLGSKSLHSLRLRFFQLNFIIHHTSQSLGPPSTPHTPHQWLLPFTSVRSARLDDSSWPSQYLNPISQYSSHKWPLAKNLDCLQPPRNNNT